MTVEAEAPGSSRSQSKKNSKGILCIKCGHVSPAGTTRCERCNGHLHIKCNDCGATNARSAPRCSECGRRLHRTTFEKVNRKLFNQGAEVKPWQFILAILAAIAVFGLIMFLLHLRFPKLF